MKKGGKRGGNSDRVVIKSDVIAKFLRDFNWSDDFQTMQFMTLDMNDQKLESLNNALLEVKHLKYIDFSHNKLADVSVLQSFDQLLHLNLTDCNLKNLAAFTTEDGFPKLKKLELADNKLSELVSITPKKLEYLDISGMKIDKYEGWTGHPTIKIFKAEDNKFKNLVIIKDMPSLEVVYLAGNNINSFSGYENVPALKKLYLQGQKISKIEEELPEMPSLELVDLSHNSINTLDNLKNIFQFTTLRHLNILETNLEKNATSSNMLLAEVLILYHSLETFCTFPVTEQHKYESLYLSEFRWRKAENERLRKEEEERLKAEGEGGEDK